MYIYICVCVYTLSFINIYNVVSFNLLTYIYIYIYIYKLRNIIIYVIFLQL